MQVIIPLAGKGIRFKEKYKEPKPLIDIFGKPMILRAVETFDKNSNFFFILKENRYSSSIINLLKKKFLYLYVEIVQYLLIKSKFLSNIKKK